MRITVTTACVRFGGIKSDRVAIFGRKQHSTNQKRAYPFRKDKYKIIDAKAFS
nr:MAG TPA: hypothetical protein [Caudoviricetes sp.]